MASSLDQTCGEVEFTRELTEALLYEKFDDDKRDGKELADYVKDLKDCTTKWHEKKMSYLLEEDRLRSLLDLFKTKCTDADEEEKKKVDELHAMHSNLRQSIATLEEELGKKVTEETDAIDSFSREREAWEAAEVSLLGKIEQVQEEILFAKKRVSKLEDDINQTLEHSRKLQECNSELEIDIRKMNEARKRADMERLTSQIHGDLNIVEKLIKLVKGGASLNQVG